MLAYHCEAAGDSARALPLLVRAGEHALSRYANEEATNFFDRAAELYASMSATGIYPPSLRPRDTPDVMVVQTPQGDAPPSNLAR